MIKRMLINSFGWMISISVALIVVNLVMHKDFSLIGCIAGVLVFGILHFAINYWLEYRKLKKNRL